MYVKIFVNLSFCLPLQASVQTDSGLTWFNHHCSTWREQYIIHFNMNGFLDLHLHQITIIFINTSLLSVWKYLTSSMNYHIVKSFFFISYQYHMIERKTRFIVYHLPLHVDTLEKEKLQEQESTPTDRPYAWVAHKHLPKAVTMYIQSIIYKNNQSWKLALKSKRGTVNHRCM